MAGVLSKQKGRRQIKAPVAGLHKSPEGRASKSLASFPL